VSWISEASNRYEQGFLFAEQAYTYALEHLGSEHPVTINSMSNLARLYQDQGWYSKAESLYKDVLLCRKKLLGPKHPDTLIAINNLAEVYRLQGKYREVEPLSKEGLHIRKKVIRRNHTKSPAPVNRLKQDQDQDVKIEQDQKKYLHVYEKNQGDDRVSVLGSINSLAFQYQNQGRYSEAEPLFKEALQIHKNMLGQEHPDTLISINSLALLYQDQGRHFEAKPLFEKVLRRRKKVLGWEHPDTLSSMNALATLYVALGRYSEADSRIKDGLKIAEGLFGSAVMAVAFPDWNEVDHYAVGLYSKAETLYQNVLQQRKEKLGPEHPDTLTSINNFAGLYCVEKRYEKAEPLYKEALQLRKKVLGREHPDTLTSINDIAALYFILGRYSEAESLYKKALQLRGKVLGMEHPDTLNTQKAYITLLAGTNKPDRALQQLNRLEDRLFSRSFHEFYNSSSHKDRSQFYILQVFSVI
jgi:tetratricopeptide (TPR) repeat protein